MPRAETFVSAGLGIIDGGFYNGNNNRIVRTNDGTLYLVWIGADNDVYISKSIDNGISWGVASLQSVFSGTALSVSVWHDHESGYAGNILHIVWIESVTDDVLYRPFDTSNDTLGTQRTIFDGATSGSSTDIEASIVRARGGNLYCAYDIDGGTEIGFARSTDNGVTWTSRTDLHEASAGHDLILLCPGFAADNQDIFAIFWDISANEISRKVYDDSANTWSETSIATSMADAPGTSGSPQFSIVVDVANSRVILAAWSAFDLANADLRCWFITDSSITETTTNVVLNSTDDQGLCSVCLDVNNGDIYVFYCGKSDGSETASTAWNIYYKVSTDDGATWGSETLVTYYPSNRKWIGAPKFVSPPACLPVATLLVFTGTNQLLCITVVPPQVSPILMIGF